MPIKTILAGNKINKVEAILNGTTNYILTKMEEENLSYEECLLKAQKLGYAETDPTGDVEGYDAMYKIAILANIVFNKRIDYTKIYREGITKISAGDIKIADELGYKIKLIAQAKKVENSDMLDIRVHPMLVDKNKSGFFACTGKVPYLCRRFTRYLVSALFFGGRNEKGIG